MQTIQGEDYFPSEEAVGVLCDTCFEGWQHAYIYITNLIITSLLLSACVIKVCGEPGETIWGWMRACRARPHAGSTFLSFVVMGRFSRAESPLGQVPPETAYHWNITAYFSFR